jgi:rod shape-determining protein MreC
LVTELAFLIIQVPAGQSQGSAFEGLALRVVGPLAVAVSGIAGAGYDRLSDLRSRASLLEENRRLSAERDRLREQVVLLQGYEAQAKQLAVAVDYAAPFQRTLRAADIVYADHLSWLRTLVLYVGARPVALDTTVLAPRGLVGRVIAVGGDYAKVQMVTDRTAGVGAMIERTRRQGIIRGAGTAELELDYLPIQADVTVGDRVVTSGVDGVFPRGLLVGYVRAVGPGGGLFHSIEVSPAVDFGDLDQVYLLAGKELPSNMREGVSNAVP